uniref:Uncharacterized protein ORF n=1 Tax=Thermochromatium tepidum TaxID=1050 RepID=D2Z0P0_THETI|nr:hypothetical protein [Thermochromatium tepidum]
MGAQLVRVCLSAVVGSYMALPVVPLSAA